MTSKPVQLITVPLSVWALMWNAIGMAMSRADSMPREARTILDTLSTWSRAEDARGASAVLVADHVKVLDEALRWMPRDVEPERSQVQALRAMLAIAIGVE